MRLTNKVQLITYPDSLGGNLKNLHSVLETKFANLFPGGVHILPPFPSSGDRGFAPLTYLEIEPEFGDWSDVRAIGEHYDILIDLMVNHISRKSEFFQDFVKHGRKSKYADLFITLDKIWEDGQPKQEDLDLIFTRRELPYSEYEIEDSGKKENIWTTFGKTDPSEQIDLDINSEVTRKLLQEFLENFHRQNIKIIRLDAIGYVVKKMGTSCFFVEPEIYEFMNWVRDIAASLDMEILPEIHSHYSIQYKLSEHGFWIYDFILPYVVLEALMDKTSGRLCKYLKERPHKQFTMLDCHDGIPVKPDLNDVVPTSDARKFVDTCVERGANLSRIFSAKHRDEDGFDVHQVRGTIYSVLGCDDDAYIAARAIQLFTPGIPQIYYVGMLAGENNEEKIKETGDGREINRQNFSLEEIDQALEKSVVKRLIDLIHFRNTFPAFDGSFEVVESSDAEVVLAWSADNSFCRLNLDLNKMTSVVEYSSAGQEKVTITF